MRTLRIISVIGASALLLSASAAFAEEGPSANSKRRGEASDVRAVATTTTRAELKSAAQERMEASREEAKQKMETAREEAKARVQDKKEKAEQRLKEIQDKTKQQMAQKLAAQFENLNERWASRFMNLLDKYDSLVQKMENRSAIAAGNGKDVTAADAAIESAKAAITAARAAVITQAAKTYTLDISSVAVATGATTTASHQSALVKSLRDSFKNLHDILFKDLFALRDGQMKDARKAVQDALQTLGKVQGVDEKSATSTTAGPNQ